MDLWADFDNSIFPPETVRHGRTRRITEQVVLSALRDWLLREYVTSYCRSLEATRIYRRCYWIDALGGDVRASTQATITTTQESAPREKGRKKQALASESTSITLYEWLLEAGSSKRKEVRATGNAGRPAKPFVFPRESGVIRASWLEAAPLLLKEIEQAPAIFLLNPLRQMMFTYDDLALLYQRTAPTELCLLISHKQVEAHLLAAQRTTAEAAALTAVLRTDRWKTLFTNDEITPLAIEGFINLYLNTMQKHFLTVQRLPFLMQVRPALVETVPYTLLFATRRQDSLASMNDAWCLYQRELQEQSHQGILGEEWFATQQQARFDQEKEQLYARMLRQGRSQHSRRWPDLRQQLLLASFGQFTIQEYNEGIQRLLAQGAVRCEWRRVASPRVSPDVTNANGATAEITPPPGNDDTLFWKE